MTLSTFYTLFLADYKVLIRFQYASCVMEANQSGWLRSQVYCIAVTLRVRLVKRQWMVSISLPWELLSWRDLLIFIQVDYIKL